MKTITVNVSETVYEEFQEHAVRSSRKTSELIREAMEEYRKAHMDRQTSLRNRRPTSVGGAISPISSDDDILGEMLGDQFAMTYGVDSDFIVACEVVDHPFHSLADSFL